MRTPRHGKGAATSQDGWSLEGFAQYVRSIEKAPPAWYQALEATLIGIGIACFCFGETNPGKARFIESEPWFRYKSVLDLSLEDIVNLLFCLELVLRGWANGFAFKWFVTGTSVVDLLSCLPIIDRAFSLTPSSELTLELTILRSLRFARVARLLKATSRVADEGGRQEVSVGLSLVKVSLSAIGTLSIASGLLWRVEGRNGLNPSIQSFYDACFYMLNVFTSQGAPFAVVSTEGRFVTSVAIVVGLLTIPVGVAELATALTRLSPDDEDAAEGPSGASKSQRGEAGLAKEIELGVGAALADLPVLGGVPRADDLREGLVGVAVPDFCEYAGVDAAALEPGAAEAELADFFTLLEDPVTARFVAADPRLRIKLAAALIRWKRLHEGLVGPPESLATAAPRPSKGAEP